MRLLLDAHLSGRVIARRLRDAWEDEALLGLAAAAGRIVATVNVKDFPRINQELDSHWPALLSGWSDAPGRRNLEPTPPPRPPRRSAA